MKQKLGYKCFFPPSVYDPLNLRLRISNTQAIFSNACTCYLVIPQGLVTIFIFFRVLLKTTREESKMSNFHTPLFQNSFVLVS